MPEDHRDLKLPPPNTKPWTIRRKAAVLKAVWNGMPTVQQASRRYNISVEEFSAWERDFSRHGLYGLRATRVQICREHAES